MRTDFNGKIRWEPCVSTAFLKATKDYVRQRIPFAIRRVEVKEVERNPGIFQVWFLGQLGGLRGPYFDKVVRLEPQSEICESKYEWPASARAAFLELSSWFVFDRVTFTLTDTRIGVIRDDGRLLNRKFRFYGGCFYKGSPVDFKAEVTVFVVKEHGDWRALPGSRVLLNDAFMNDPRSKEAPLLIQ